MIHPLYRNKIKDDFNLMEYYNSEESMRLIESMNWEFVKGPFVNF